MPEATIKDVKDYFGFTDNTKFVSEWKSLSDQDKADLRAGIGNGSFTY